MTTTAAEPSIPTYRDLLYPTLRALDQLGGSGRKDEVNETVIALLGLTDEQLGVEYPPTGKAHGSKVLHRLAFARSSLKLAGGLDNSQRGVDAVQHTIRRFEGNNSWESLDHDTLPEWVADGVCRFHDDAGYRLRAMRCSSRR